ncbi:MAG: serine hydrolase [Candidatus Omnitrophota bacterium]
MKKKIIIVLLSLGVILTSAYFLITALKRPAQSMNQVKLLPQLKNQEDKRRSLQYWQYMKQSIDHRAGNFKGTAGIVIEDLKRDYTFGLNENIPLPSASLVKIPVMAACFYAASQGKINLKAYLVLKNSSKTSGSGRLKSYPAGTQVTIEKLIEIMIEESDNTASNMLIDLLGFNYLNDTFKKLGLKNTNIVRKMMDFKSRKRGRENFTTAADLAFMLKQIYEGKLINKEISAKCLEILKKQKMRDRIPAKLPSGTVVAHKTGLERRICHDVGIIFTYRGDMLVCVLTRHKNKTAQAAKHFISYTALDAYNYAARQ